MLWKSLPKFFLCDQNSETDNDRIFVLHCQSPRFLMEFVPGGEGDLLMIDTGAKAAEVDEAKKRARDFFEEGAS